MSRTYTMSMPWPKPALSPNARGSWKKRYGFTKSARIAAGWVAVRARLHLIGAKKLDVRITFIPPDNRRRDKDNMIGSIKAYCDGIADTCAVDDSKWNVSHSIGEPKAPGSVLFEITEIQA